MYKGGKSTPQAFVTACDKFVYTEKFKNMKTISTNYETIGDLNHENPVENEKKIENTDSKLWNFEKKTNSTNILSNSDEEKILEAFQSALKMNVGMFIYICLYK
jgi:hypothetical protein